MKTLLLAASIFATGLFAAPKEDEKIPDQVQKSFKQKYPDVKKVEWEKEEDKYEAEFEVNEKETSVLFDATGKLLETESEIDLKELPAEIVNSLSKNYLGYEVEEAAKIEAEGTITYEVELEKGKESLELVFDVSGNLLTK